MAWEDWGILGGFGDCTDNTARSESSVRAGCVGSMRTFSYGDHLRLGGGITTNEDSDLRNDGHTVGYHCRQHRDFAIEIRAPQRNTSGAEDFD